MHDNIAIDNCNKLLLIYKTYYFTIYDANIVKAC